LVKIIPNRTVPFGSILNIFLRNEIYED